MTERDEGLGMSVNFSSSAGCPADEVWIEVCADRVEREAAEHLLEHAADCERCGPLLREATIIWRDEADGSEEEFISGLRSSREGWQTDLGTRLQRESQNRAKTTRSHIGRRVYWWPVFIAAAAAAGFVALLVYRNNHSIDVLLAQAYDHERLTELRIPGGQPVRIYSPERGINTVEHEPLELLEARAIAERALQTDSTNAYWHQVLGRIEVIEAEPESALADLELAETRDSMLPHLEFDLGSAYFELGTQTGDASNFGYAEERFSRYLDSVHGQDPVALYDRALCWQETGVPELARKDLSAAIQIERNAAWRQAMQSRLDSIGSHTVPSGQSMGGENPSRAEDGYEDQLAAVLERRLTDSSPAAVADLRRVARLGRTHGDYWLSDWMAASNRRRSPMADKALTASIRQNLAGDSARALQNSVAAQHAYRVAGNLPGALRSRTEEIYAYRRMGQPHYCLQRLAHLPIQVHRYVWLSDDLTLEHAVCLFQVGQFDMAEEQAQLAWRMAASHQLSLLAIRARAFSADFLTNQGLAEEGWEMNSRALQASDMRAISPMGRYQILSDLTLDAAALGLADSAVLLSGEAARIADQTGNLQIAAYAWELQGHDQVTAGRLSDARLSFARADEILACLGESDATATYRADWTADRAKLQLATGQGKQALAAMDNALPAIDQTHSLLIEINYWASRAQIERGTGNESGTLSSATRAVESAQTALAQLTTREARRAWQLNTEAAYMELVDSLAETDRPGDALHHWLWFRGAADRVDSHGGKNIAASQFLASYSFRSAPDGETLVYARLQKQYVVFAIGPGQGEIRIHHLAIDPNSLDQMIRTFALLCADPGSRLAEVQSLGRELYATLLAPVLRGNPTEIRIDPSGALGRLPFTALVVPSGAYLGSVIRIVYLPQWWSVGPSPSPVASIRYDRLLLVDAAASSSARRTIPAEYDESTQIASMFPHAEIVTPSSVALRKLLLDLPTADVFHFAGHAFSEDGAAQLFLFNPPGQIPVVLTPDSLARSALPKCRLAFLAGCSTLGENSGRIAEPLALPSAFLRAGATDVIATRWNVDSEASKRLALAFYREFLEGNSPSFSLQIAQGVIRSDPRFQHPYYWSAFCLIER